MIDTKLIALIGVVAVCAFLGGMLINTGAPEAGPDSGDEDLSPPPLPEDEGSEDGEPMLLEEPGNGTEGGLADIFGDSGGIAPPPLPS